MVRFAMLKLLRHRRGLDPNLHGCLSLEYSKFHLSIHSLSREIKGEIFMPTSPRIQLTTAHPQMFPSTYKLSLLLLGFAIPAIIATPTTTTSTEPAPTP